MSKKIACLVPGGFASSNGKHIKTMIEASAMYPKFVEKFGRHSGLPRITVRGSATPNPDVRAGLKPAPTRYPLSRV